MDRTVSLYTNYNNADRRTERSRRLGIHRQKSGNASTKSSHNIGRQYAKSSAFRNISTKTAKKGRTRICSMLHLRK